MNVILFDQEQSWKNLLPLTYTRPVSEIRIGILTIKEKWDLEYDLSFDHEDNKNDGKRKSLVDEPKKSNENNKKDLISAQYKSLKQIA